MSEHLVSVIMPFRNTGKYIDESIRSVVEQSYSGWELILVDDGSLDEAAEIAKTWAAREPSRIKLLPAAEEGPAGASAARNRGIRASSGDVIAFLDSDDVWLPNKLSEQLPLLEKYPEAEVVFGNTLYWYSWADARAGDSADHLPELGVAPGRLLQPPRFLELMLRGLASIPCTCSMLIRRRAVEQTGGFEEQFRIVYTDQVFYAKLFLHAPVVAVPTVWDKYRRHDESSCSTAEQQGIMVSTRRRYLEWLAGHLTRRGMEGTAVWHAVQAELRWIDASPVAQRIRRFGIKMRRRTRKLRRGGA
jgi:glycosyltransferase involved in cell wall biosynthesis